MSDLGARSIITMQHVWALYNNERAGAPGTGTVEYALILAFIALVVVAAVKFVGPAVAATFNNVTNTLNTSGTPAPLATRHLRPPY
jgi:pilus assembly protein Flp/PilA